LPQIDSDDVVIVNVSGGAGAAYAAGTIQVQFPQQTYPTYSHTNIYVSTDDDGSGSGTYYYAGQDSDGEAYLNGLGVFWDYGNTVYIKLQNVTITGVASVLPTLPDGSVIIDANMKLAGFYAGQNDIWGGNASISHADTKIVIGSMEGTPKIALGGTADTIAIDNIASYPGFFADGNGYFRGGTDGKYLRWDGEIEIQAGGLFLSSETQTLSLGDGIYLDGLNETIVVGNVAADGIMFDPVNGQRMYDGGTLKGQWNLDSAWWLGPNSTNKKVEWNPSDDTFYIRGNAAFDTLVFQEVMTTKGTIQVVKSGGELFDTFSVAAGPLSLKITKSPSGGAPFGSGHKLLIDNGINSTWLTVSAFDALDQTTYWEYLVTYSSGSNSVTYKTGTAIADYGVSGDGGLLLSSDMSNAPWLSIFKHSGSPWSDMEYLVKLGNLNGYAGYTSDVYGLAAYIDANNYIKIDPVSGISMSGAISITNSSDYEYQLPSDRNLVAYWSFDDGSGAVAVDNSGRGHDATLVNTPTWVQGIASGKAIDFEKASSQYASVPHHADINFEYNTPFSISAWVQLESLDSFNFIFSKLDSAGRGYSFVINYITKSVYFQLFSNTSTNYMIAYTVPDIIEAGNKYHIVATYDGSSARAGVHIYINGQDIDIVEAGLDALSATIQNTEPAFIGKNYSATYFDGIVDECRAYNTTLTSDEVKALYLNPSGNKSQTVNMDSITNGTYGKVLSTDISAGHIVLSSGTGAVNWSTQVGGTGKPSDNATVGATWGSNLSSIPSDIFYKNSNTLDNITNGATYGKVQVSILDSGYLALLRRAATTDQQIIITASGVEQYTNGVKMIELATGNLYLGDQANEHLKASSTGIELKDNTTVLSYFDQYGGHSSVQPSFLTYGADLQENVTGDGTYADVAFNTEVFDTGSDFNPATYTFTAPCAGRYILSAHLYIMGIAAAHNNSVIRIVTSNRTYWSFITPIATGEEGLSIGTITSLADMDASDTAKVVISVDGSTKTVDVWGINFSGELLG
jgi:hypothetical protein